MMRSCGNYKRNTSHRSDSVSRLSCLCTDCSFGCLWSWL